VQGLLVLPGNPFGIRGLEDLGWGDIRFINRSKGSGTRLWLDRQVNALGLDPVKIPGFTLEVNTHAEVAAAVRKGLADTGLAVQAACIREGLDFVPLFEERYDLVIPEDEFKSERLLPILEHIHTGKFIKTLEGLGGYNPHNTGKEILI
jgi:putative molybdopterin biosynthesis protein